MTSPAPPSAWCEIHRGRITRNIDLALELVPAGRRFCAVLKADAYGHGIEQVVPLVMAQGITTIGITTNGEAAAVRQAGFGGAVIRLRAATPTEMAEAGAWCVEEQVGSVAAARSLVAMRDQGARVRAHLTLNANGMSRDGLELSTGSGRAMCQEIVDLLGRDIVGIGTHYPCHQRQNLRSSAALFHQQVAWVFEQSNLIRSETCVHGGSSLTLVSKERVETDMYRCGAILYGILKPEWGFQTTMALKARVVSLGSYPKGNTVGYDKAYELRDDARLACVSIGYANGVRRELQGIGTVTIAETPVPVLGKISMNSLVADVSQIADVSIGDEAVVFDGATHGRAALAETERAFGTILADLFTDWGARNHRICR